MVTRRTLITLFSACAVAGASAQVEMTKELPTLYGVTNEGVAVGTPFQNNPYYLWNPEEGSVTEIGGISAGQGIGGVARFTDDGKTVAAVMQSDTVRLTTEWQAAVVDKGFIITDIFTPSTTIGSLAIARTADNDSTVILRSFNGGVTWKMVGYSGMIPSDGKKGGLVTGCMLTADTYPDRYFVAGHNGVAYYSSLGTESATAFDPRPAGSQDEVDTYWAIDFIDKEPYVGVFGAELTDGTAKVYQTPDGAETFQEATGVTGIPAHITHAGETFFMVTQNGHIQKSEDGGLSWTDIFTEEKGNEFFDICFLDENIGIATSTDCIYRTEDAGANWTKIEVGLGISPGSLEDSNGWFNVAFNTEKVAISGSNGQIYESTDKGLTWKQVKADELEGTNLYALSLHDDYIIAGGDNGVLCRKSFEAEVSMATAALYGVESGQWTQLDNLGYASDVSVSSAYNISGDGSTTVGLTYVQDGSGVFAHAVAWTQDGPVDLGSKFQGEYTRANAVSYDGSVIAGLQDKLGPWHATVWYRNEDGTYTEPQYIFAEEGMTDDDVNFDDMVDMTTKMPGFAQCVSSDGKWIGGNGNYAPLDCPWIWSKETGLVKIGEPGYNGCVSDMNNDATVLVGWNGSGESGWIWTEEIGKMDINTFVEKELGVELDGVVLCSVYDMSPNGRYIVGYGLNSNSEFFGYRVDLKDWLSVRETETGKCEAAVYPNPVSDELHIDFLDNAESLIRLYDMQGRLVLETRRSDMNNVVNISDVEEGLYVLDVTFDGMRRTFKIEINH